MRRPRVYEVDGRAVQFGGVLRQCVQPGLEPPPVVPVGPVPAETAQPVDGYALAPVGNGGRLGPPRVRQPPAQVVEFLVRHVDREGDHGATVLRTADTNDHETAPARVAGTSRAPRSRSPR